MGNIMGYVKSKIDVYDKDKKECGESLKMFDKYFKSPTYNFIEFKNAVKSTMYSQESYRYRYINTRDVFTPKEQDTLQRMLCNNQENQYSKSHRVLLARILYKTFIPFDVIYKTILKNYKISIFDLCYILGLNIKMVSCFKAYPMLLFWGLELDLNKSKLRIVKITDNIYNEF